MKNSFIVFLQSTPGRILRIVLGLAVAAGGVLLIQGTAGFVVAIIGLIPISAALTGVCFIGPLFGYTFEGQKR